MTQLKKDEGAREPFRRHLAIDKVARVKQDPNYSYKLVIWDYPKNPMNFDKHEAKGYEVVYSQDSVEDDRGYTPNTGVQDQEKLRMVAVTNRTTDGYNQVLMRISKLKEIANKRQEHKENEDKYKRSSKSSLRKTKGQVYITGEEVDTTGAKSYNPTNNNDEGN